MQLTQQIIKWFSKTCLRVEHQSLSKKQEGALILISQREGYVLLKSVLYEKFQSQKLKSPHLMHNINDTIICLWTYITYLDPRVRQTIIGMLCRHNFRRNRIAIEILLIVYILIFFLSKLFRPQPVSLFKTNRPTVYRTSTYLIYLNICLTFI